MEQRKAAAAAAASTGSSPPILVSALSASVLQDQRAAASERAALERTVRERISGRQRHAAAIQRPGVEDRDPATLMEPLVISRTVATPEPEELAARGTKEEVHSVSGPASRAWSLVRGDPEVWRRLGQRLEAVAKVTEMRTGKKEVEEVSGAAAVFQQGIRNFIQRIFHSL
jgi:hypothetical protein